MTEKKEPLHPEEVVTTFFLIRHGHTKPTEEGLLYTDPNAPLTEKGEKQAQALAQWLPGQNTELLLSSPSLRVFSTAEIVANAMGIKPHIIETLNEWNVGDWDGKSYWEIKEKEPDAYARWSKDPIHHAPPGGESIVGVCERVREQLKSIIAAHEGKCIALVTHAGVIRGILAFALGIPAENFWRINIPTGSVSKVDFSVNFATVQFTSFSP